MRCIELCEHRRNGFFKAPSVIIVQQSSLRLGCNCFALDHIIQIISALSLEVREVPFYRNVGYERNKYIWLGSQMFHFLLDKQATTEDCLEIAPANLAVAKGANAYLAVKKFSIVFGLVNTVCRQYNAKF